jgi:hypothetical protein
MSRGSAIYSAIDKPTNAEVTCQKPDEKNSLVGIGARAYVCVWRFANRIDASANCKKCLIGLNLACAQQQQQQQ